ncbi:hypothetical protein BDV96DRAFT_592987 [Lophiotrema nucula]|uniref:P-loop containing nucleoside triphosphate hydrolase protein n=1 Tax=Lophiotrema nucula TaxID=690887 RepID=A0A6A5ZW09_9PLEO|nr:hypothetical protein BDV96DRAFT_592987 [Lophiotrema nucula]
MGAAPVLYINGFPGTGKLTVARAIIGLLGEDQALLIDNHGLIDPVEARCGRSHPRYLIERRKERERTFRLYVYDKGTRFKTLVFTGNEYLFLERPDAARKAGRMFIPVNLFCDIEENVQRICSDDRAHSGTTKLLDPKILVDLRSRFEIFRFDIPEELCLNITSKEPEEVARAIVKWLTSWRASRIRSY